MTSCSIQGCTVFVSPNQEKTTKSLYGKPYCKDHEIQANIDAKKETEALMTPRAKVLALLARRGFEEHSIPGFFLLDNGGTKVAVDLNKISGKQPGTLIPVIGILQANGDIQEEGHGINRIDNLRQEIEGILKSNSKKSQSSSTDILKAQIPAEKSLFTNPLNQVMEATRTKLGTSDTSTFLTPVTTIEDALVGFEMFEMAKTKLLKDSDVLWIGANGRPAPKGTGHPHIKRSGWRKLARFFGINCSILGKEKISSEDSEGKFYIWKFRARAEHSTGGFFEADGVCTSRDPFFSKKNGVRIEPDEADIILKAQTVAFNRALSDLLGSGEVSADEIKTVN